MKNVYTARSLADAHLVKGLLEAAGIEAQVQGEQTFQITGQVPSKLTPLTVWILDDEDIEKAEELVSSIREENGEGPVGESPWRCACGEGNEGRFTECWRCGRTRPDFENSEGG